MPRDRGAERATGAHRTAGGEHVPVAAGSALRARQRGIDDRGLGVAIGRALAGPACRRKQLQRPIFRPSAAVVPVVECSSPAVPFRVASRRSSGERPWSGRCAAGGRATPSAPAVVGGGPAGGGGAFHQRDRQVDADAVAGQRPARGRRCCTLGRLGVGRRGRTAGSRLRYSSVRRRSSRRRSRDRARAGGRAAALAVGAS